MSKGPVYKQGEIVAELERRIDTGVYGSCIPPGGELAAEFGVNIKTVNKAVGLLVEAGRLDRRRGVGTFVISRCAGERQIEVLFEGYSSLFDHPFWGEIWNGCIARLIDYGYRPVLTRVRADDSGKLLLDDFHFCRTEGKVLFGITQPEFLRMVQEQNVPAVSAGDRLSDPEFMQVYFDYEPGIGDAMRFLTARNCRKIAFFGETKDTFNPMLLSKFHAYRKTLEPLGLYDPALSEHIRPLPEAAGNALRVLLERTVPDALFVAGDHQVPDVEKVLKEKGLRLPVIGCDGLAFATWPTVKLPRRAAGEAAARLLVSSLAGRLTEDRVVLPSCFVH